MYMATERDQTLIVGGQGNCPYEPWNCRNPVQRSEVAERDPLPCNRARRAAAVVLVENALLLTADPCPPRFWGPCSTKAETLEIQSVALSPGRTQPIIAGLCALPLRGVSASDASRNLKGSPPLERTTDMFRQ